jgi:DNA-binding transcriptional LysR family regulator
MSTAGSLDERVLRRLKLRELRILTTVAQAGSMGKAAVQLALSQPAVSKAIAEMEHTLGAPLLDRRAQGVEPTLYGRALLKWAVALFDDLRQGVREIEFLADPTGGEVRIGCSEMMNAGLLPAVIDRLSQQYPRLMFTVTQAPSITAQYRDLRERRVDFVFGRMMTPIKDEDDLDAEILFEDPLIVVASAAANGLDVARSSPLS